MQYDYSSELYHHGIKGMYDMEKRGKVNKKWRD